MCLGEEHARSFRGGCAHCERFTMRKLHSRLAQFSRNVGQTSRAGALWLLKQSGDLRCWVHRSSWLRSSRKVCLSHSSVTSQASGALHIMAELQAYQADLLKDLDQGQGLSHEAVAELRRTTDLALRANKQIDALVVQWWPQ